MNELNELGHLIHDEDLLSQWLNESGHVIHSCDIWDNLIHSNKRKGAEDVQMCTKLLMTINQLNCVINRTIIQAKRKMKGEKW